jgi:hypothetical protein
MKSSPLWDGLLAQSVLYVSAGDFSQPFLTYSLSFILVWVYDYCLEWSPGTGCGDDSRVQGLVSCPLVPCMGESLSYCG